MAAAAHGQLAGHSDLLWAIVHRTAGSGDTGDQGQATRLDRNGSLRGGSGIWVEGGSKWHLVRAADPAAPSASADKLSAGAAMEARPGRRCRTGCLEYADCRRAPWLHGAGFTLGSSAFATQRHP